MMRLKQDPDPASFLLKEWGKQGGTLHDLMLVLSARLDDGLKKIALLEDVLEVIGKEYGVEVNTSDYPGLEQ